MATPTKTGTLAQSSIFVPPPPRISGNAAQDLVSLVGWIQQFYNALGLTNYEVSGLFAIVGTDVSCEIPFDANRQQPDTEYYVTFSAESFTGSPVLAALSVTHVEKLKDKFIVTINTAPGAGNTVTLAYSVRR